MTVKEIYDVIDGFAPFDTAEEFDNPGILVGGAHKEVHRVLVALDLTKEVALEAARKNADMVLTHHPAIFHPLSSVDLDSPVAILVKNSIPLISAHTNLDKSVTGTSAYMTRLLGLRDVEYRGYLAVGNLEKETDIGEFCALVKKVFYADKIRAAVGKKKIKRVAVCAGAGGDMIYEAAGVADVLVTGDVKHNYFIDAGNMGFSLIDAGHYETEKAYIPELVRIMTEKTGLEFFESETEKRPYDIGE